MFLGPVFELRQSVERKWAIPDVRKRIHFGSLNSNLLRKSLGKYAADGGTLKLEAVAATAPCLERSYMCFKSQPLRLELSSL